MTQELGTEQKLQIVREAVDERKAENIEVLDLRDRTLVADFFVVASGTSNVHIRGIVDNVVKKLREHKVHVDRIEGYKEARWVLADFGDVVVHVFADEEREYYDLESLWRAAADKLGVS